jgi:hypothetical protein
MRVKTLAGEGLAAGVAVALALTAPATAMGGERLAGDFHQHTLYTDGSTSFDFVMSKNNEFGLDWWANSEHGGTSGWDGNGIFWDVADPVSGRAPVTPLGKPVTSGGHPAMWRWQGLRDFVFPDVVRNRSIYPAKRIFSGLEWNVPGHEHCSTGIVAQDASAASAFEYMFDKSDGDTSRTGEVTPYGTLAKTNKTDADAVAACAWMQQQYQDKRIDNGWIVFAHVERAGAWNGTSGGYNVENFRNFNNAGPDVCFGFEGAPGHQVEPYRGLGNTVKCGQTGLDPFQRGCSSKDFGGTYGGVGFYTAKVGGLWDALLGEGRHFFNFASSDYHQHWSVGGGDFYPGEYQKVWVTAKADTTGGFGGSEYDGDLNAIVDGLRSGNSFFVQGDLINHLEFTAWQANRKGTMGEDLVVEGGKKGHPVQLKIKFRSPSVNHNGDSPVVDHIDLIAGEITGKVSPSDPSYKNPTNPSAKVIASFTAKDWERDEDGSYTIVHTIKDFTESTYFRLRGTNLGCDTPNQTGPVTALPSADYCSPLPDALEPISTDLAKNAQKAFADLWFYSNPIFVHVK